MKLLSAFEAGLLIDLWAFSYVLIKSHVMILLVRQARVRFICNRLRTYRLDYHSMDQNNAVLSDT